MRRAVGRKSSRAEEVGIAKDGVERRPQLVRQHREKFVLQTTRALHIDACRLFARQELPALLLDGFPLTDIRDGREDERAGGRLDRAQPDLDRHL